MRGLGERGGIFFNLMALVFLLALLALIYAARHPLLRLAGGFWVVDEPARHADAIIVLGDDNYAGDRAGRAAGLFRDGVAPEVVASGRMLRPYAGLSEMMERDLEADGVPASSIMRFSHRAGSTAEEAEALSGMVKSRGWKRVLVVTSNYHTRRARFIFERVFPAGVAIQVVAARDSEFDPAHWWETRRGQKLFLNELLGYIEARWELRHVPRASATVTLMFPGGGDGFGGGTPAAAGSGRAKMPYLIGNIRGLQPSDFVL